MILRRLRVRRFKRFDDTTFTFGPGLNLIQGPNESGKTTLMEALFAALLVNPAQPPPGFGDLVRPWGEARLGELVLEFEVDGAAHLVRKDLEAGTALLQPPEGKGKGASDNPREIQQRILEWLGLPSEGAFRSSAFVAQGELARMTDERHLIGARLSRIISGAGTEDVDAALRWLEERSRQPDGSGRGDGRADRLEDLLTQQQELARKEERAQALWGELRTVGRQLDDLERQMVARMDQVNAAEQQAALQRRLDDLEKELRDHRDLLLRLDRHQTRLAGLEARQKSFADQNQAALQALVATRRTAQGLQQAAGTGRQQLQREEATLEQLATRTHRARNQAWVGLVLTTLGVVAILLGLLLPQLRATPPGWAAVAAGIVAFVLALRSRGRVGEAEAFYRRQEQRVLDLRRKVEKALDEMQTAERDLQVRLASLGAASVEAVEQRFAAYMDAARQQEETRLAIQQLLAGRPRERIEERAAAIEGELEAVRGRLQAISGGGRVPDAMRDRLVREAQALQREAATLRERKSRIEGLLVGLLDRPEARETTEERIAALRAREARTAETGEVLAFTRRMIEEARKQSFFPARELLERRAGELLKVATGNGYQRVSLEERSLTPRVWVEAARGWKGPQGLSSGTVDQLYLSLRLALLEVICQGRTPPLFLDEPFAHFDPDRGQSVRTLVEAAARERQVFLFTSWPPQDLRAAQVINLSAPGASTR